MHIQCTFCIFAKYELYFYHEVYHFFINFILFSGVSIANVQSIEYPDKRTIFLHNLKPGAGHEFRVSAINAFGIGAPSLPTGEPIFAFCVVFFYIYIYTGV